MQAVIDAYVHVLKESKGRTRPELLPAEDLAETMVEAMTLRTASLRPDELMVSDGRLRIEPFATPIRPHFAVRFGGKDEEEGGVAKEARAGRIPFAILAVCPCVDFGGPGGG